MTESRVRPPPPRPINNVKIYNDNVGGAPKFMRNVIAGLASTRFHRPVPWNGGTRGLGLNDEARRILRSVRTFTDALDWFELQPRPKLLSDNGSGSSIGYSTTTVCP